MNTTDATRLVCPIAAVSAATTAEYNSNKALTIMSKQLNQQQTKLKGKCDICRKPDGFWGHNLQQCQTCHVLVHELCYGMPETNTKDVHFVCRACRAVGVEVEVNVPSIVGGVVGDDDDKDPCSTNTSTGRRHREWIKQETRPTVCVLCSHDKGIHAMHPLLDVHGPEGRQLTWNGRVKPQHHHHQLHHHQQQQQQAQPQLAWVHTLCASVICSNASTRGCVYGCDKNGNYYGDEDDEDDGQSSDEEEELKVSFDDHNLQNSRCTAATKGDFLNNDNNDAMKYSYNTCRLVSSGASSVEGDNSSSSVKQDDNSSSSSEDQEDDDEAMSTMYYAIASDGIYARTIANHRKLKCFVCGRKDDVWRIPVQCTAGDEEEYGPFQERHPLGTEQCTVAVHVGCARWGCVEPEGSHLEAIDGKRCNLCFFTPGRDDSDDHHNGEDEKKEDDDSNGTKADTSETVAHCYCSVHARDIVMNHPRNARKRKRTAVVSM